MFALLSNYHVFVETKYVKKNLDLIIFVGKTNIHLQNLFKKSTTTTPGPYTKSCIKGHLPEIFEQIFFKKGQKSINPY